MNCTRCNTPLEPNARFCRNCGTPVSPAQATSRDSNPSFANEPPTNYPIFQAPSAPPPTQQQWNTPPLQETRQESRPQSYSASPAQTGNRQQDGLNAGTFSNAGDTYPTPPPRRRRRGRGCLISGLLTLIVLLILIGGGWFLLARPYLNNLATTKIDSALTSAVDQIPPEVAAAPAGPVSIPEKLLNNLLVLTSSPNDLVKNMQVHITASQMRLEFSVFGFACAATGVPQVNGGHLVVTNVNIEGIAALILAPDEITTLVNRHLADAQQRINHSIVSVSLKDQELDLVLGQPGVPSGVTPPTLP